MLKVSLETLEKMTNYGAEDEPHRRVAGIVEVTVGEEKDQISGGELGVVPVMEPHNFRNIGSDMAKLIGFFSSPTVVITFEKAFLPLNFKEFDTTKLPATLGS
ncbi:MAG: hypothetical protein WBV84_05435 [Nitrososphaeraceae archaeon]